MKCKIREIAIFGKNKEKRGVTFTDGLNIITGTSQTGKSALIEIVDYCLLSSTSTIPRGKIIEFADIFAIVLEIDQKYLVIGRPSPESSDFHKFYFKVEVLEEMVDKIQKNYFDPINLMTRESLRTELGRFFGYEVTDISTELDAINSKKGVVSFRNMTPFLFQHQSLNRQ